MEQLKKPTVKTIRIALGYSQPKMAEVLGMKVGYYRQREVGEKQWEIPDADKILQLSGYRFEDIQWRP